jgi:hypothetical protein
MQNRASGQAPVVHFHHALYPAHSLRSGCFVHRASNGPCPAPRADHPQRFGRVAS